MPATTCPQCGASVPGIPDRAYCKRCGWNRENALRKLRRDRRQWPGFILFVVGMPLAWEGYYRHDWRTGAVFAGFLLIPALVVYWFSQQRFRRVQREMTRGDSVTNVEPRAPQGAHSAAEAGVSEESRVLLSLPCPRPIRMKSSGLLILFVVPLFALAVGIATGARLYRDWLPTQSVAAAPKGDLLMGCVALLLIALPYGMWRSRIQQRDLLQNGTVVLATITRQSSTNDQTSNISYEFVDSSGKKFSSTTMDPTRKLYEGMRLPVFYDPQNPGLQISSVTSSYEVVMPGKD